MINQTKTNYYKIENEDQINRLLNEAQCIKTTLKEYIQQEIPLENHPSIQVQNFLKRAQLFPDSAPIRESINEIRNLCEIHLNNNENALISLAKSLSIKSPTNPESVENDIVDLLKIAHTFKASLNLNCVYNRLEETLNTHQPNKQKIAGNLRFNEDVFCYTTNFLPVQDLRRLSMVSKNMLDLCDKDTVYHLNQGVFTKDLNIHTEQQLISILQRSYQQVVNLHVDIPINEISTILSLCPQIQKLHIKKVQEKDSNKLMMGIISHPNSFSLKELYLQGNHKKYITKNSQVLSNCSDFLYLSNLETLSLVDMDLGPNSMQSLASFHLPKLKTLDLSHQNYIGANGLQYLSQAPYFPQLEILNLSGGNQIGSEGIQILANCPPLNLKKLMLYYNHIGDIGAKLLANAPSLSLLITLDVCCNNINEKGAIAIGNSPYLSNLKKLRLGCNPIKNSGAEAILTNLNSLETVDFNSTQLDSNFAENTRFTQNMEIAPNLLYLDLSFNKLESKGAENIAHILERFPKLAFLFLVHNNIGTSGAEALLSRRPQNLTLDLSSKRKYNL